MLGMNLRIEGKNKIEEFYLLGYKSAESQPTFRRNIFLNLQDRGIRRASNQREAGRKQGLKMDVICYSETSVDFQRTIRGVIFQKIELFLTTGVRTSNPTEIELAKQMSLPQYCLNSRRSASEQYRIKNRKVIVALPGDALRCSPDHAQWKKELYHVPSIQLISCLNITRN
jgi:hypothetical protein